MIRKHWSIGYIFSRARQFIYFKLNPNDPWLPLKAIKYLTRILQSDFKGIEFGSGRSTTWIAKRVKKLISIESDKGWYSVVNQSLSSQKIKNVDYRYASVTNDPTSPYLSIYNEIENDSLNFAFIDGKNRDYCAYMAISKVKKDGWIIVDDAHRYQPTQLKIPLGISNESMIPSDTWRLFYCATKNWKQITLSNGISCTSFYQKPK